VALSQPGQAIRSGAPADRRQWDDNPLHYKICGDAKRQPRDDRVADQKWNITAEYVVNRRDAGCNNKMQQDAEQCRFQSAAPGHFAADKA